MKVRSCREIDIEYIRNAIILDNKHEDKEDN